MPETTLTVDGVQVGDYVQYFTVEPARSVNPEVQQGVLSQYARIDDQSPNVVYLLRVWIYKQITGDSAAISLCRWLTQMGAILTKGKVQVKVNDGSEELILEEATLLGPFAAPDPKLVLTGKIPELPLVFQSEKAPT